jgi:two-component system chemotaxis response regulator CheY
MAKILIVDDSSLSRMMLRGMLEQAGHDVVEASNGLTALERYSLERPDLVLLDMVMAGLHGLEVLAKLKELDANAQVVVATADIQTSTRELARAAGACNLVTKPFQVEQVLNAVRDAIDAPRPLNTGGPTRC